MARKLDNATNVTTDDHPRFGRRDYVKSGVLSTVMGAALVSSAQTASADSPQTIHVAGTGGLSSYDITVSDGILDDPNTTFDAERNISGRNAEGTVRDQVHGYRFEGELIDVRLSGEADLYLNGRPVSVNELRNR